MEGGTIVVGGGITGRLVQLLMPHVVIYDWRKEEDVKKLTRMYGANYLWEPIPELECRAFAVRTHIDWRPPTPDSIRAYKEKIGKGYETPTDWGLQFQELTTGYDIVAMPEPRIRHESVVTRIDPQNQTYTVRFDAHPPTTLHYDRLISTIPQYALANMLPMHWLLDHGIQPVGQWKWDPIYVRVLPQPPDSPADGGMYVNYLTDPAIVPYRLTDRNGERHYEAISPMPGLATRRLIPGKIHPAPDAERLCAALELHNIFCFGRYATWTPNELIHQTVTRIRLARRRLQAH